MAGTLTPPAAGSATDYGSEAEFILQGTGTGNDGKRVKATTGIDPVTGLPASSGGGGGGGAVTVADGADVAQGATTDLAVTGDNAGTLSAKLRGFAKLWADVWDSVNHYLRVSQGPAAAPAATLQSAAAATGNGTVLSVAGMSVVVFTVSGVSSPSATVTFEGTEDGTNYQGLVAANLGTGMQGSTATVTTTPTIYIASVGGLTTVRARISAYAAGTVTVTAHTTIAAYEPRVVQLSDGTTQVSVQPLGTGQNALTTAGGYKELTGLTAGALNADLVPSTDVSAYTTAIIHLPAGFTGTLSYQGSNDGINFGPVAGVFLSSSTSASSTTVANPSAGNIISISLGFHYLRVRATGYSSGTATGICKLSTLPLPLSSVGVAAAQSGNWTTSPAATSSANGSAAFHLVSAATTNPTNVKNSFGQLYGYTISNSNAAARYVKVYNLASAPTAGSGTPAHVVQVPANGTVARSFPVGMKFSAGIGFTTTTGLADADTGAVGAGDLSIDLDYS